MDEIKKVADKLINRFKRKVWGAIRHYQSRKSNGQYRRNTLQNIFGLNCEWCSNCGIGNPWYVGQTMPERCHSCNALLKPHEELTPKMSGLNHQIYNLVGGHHKYCDCKDKEVMDEIERALYQLAGHASLCWEPKPTGVLDTTEAEKAVKKALEVVRSQVNLKRLTVND